MKAKDWTNLHPQYAGQWVAFAEDEETVVAAAKSLKTTINQAKKLGIIAPPVFKVPQEMLPYVGAI
ncbi:MAG: hypothetical protein U1C50_00245 [Patescibacteria group bacterium]|nr:hypothetical protein [Candidatus Beckwithbacteria bacterium]MDZ4228664.1 hypothetical protein [Patescibacteria group bacterium]